MTCGRASLASEEAGPAACRGQVGGAAEEQSRGKSARGGALYTFGAVTPQLGLQDPDASPPIIAHHLK